MSQVKSVQVEAFEVNGKIFHYPLMHLKIVWSNQCMRT